MKRVRLFTLFTLIMMMALLAFGGCTQREAVSSVSLKDHDPATAIETVVGGFDYGAYTVLVTYDTGRTEEIALSEAMLSEAELVKLYQVGEHDVVLSYAGKNYTFKVSVKRLSLGSLHFPEDTVFTYDGKAHVVEVDGDIPANAVITYPGGNSFVNAGVYDVVAIVSCDGYVSERLTTTVTIERAHHDMSGVAFESKEFVYDGKSHALAISGTLPAGVTLSGYTIEGKAGSAATDAGEYTVKAVFASKDSNYEPIPAMEATLTIAPAEYSVEGVGLLFKGANGKAIDGATKVYDETAVTFELTGNSKVLNKLSVSYSVLDEKGNVISTSNKDTKIKDAGVYTVKVEFTAMDSKNYKPIAPLVYEFEVFKVDYPTLVGIELVSAQTKYDQKPHALAIVGTLPKGVEVEYEYYYGGELVVDKDGEPLREVVDAGRYTVKAVFTHNDRNYKEIPSISATLIIERKVVELFMVGLDTMPTVEYSGASHEARILKWQDANYAKYDILHYGTVEYYKRDGSGAYVLMGAGELPTEAGQYKVALRLSVLDDYTGNYVMPSGGNAETVSVNFEIKEKILSPTVTFDTEASLIYNTEGRPVEFLHNVDPTLVDVSTSYFRYVTNEYVPMAAGQMPTDVGEYRCVVTLALRDEYKGNYAFSDGKDTVAFNFEYEIRPQTFDVDGITLSHTALTYDGSDLTPSLQGVPAYVDAVVQLYTLEGTTPIGEAINAGEYRIEIVLESTSTNYVLSSSDTLVFNFEIQTAEIDVNNLTLGSLTFEYDGKSHLPEFVNLPAHVRIDDDLFIVVGEPGEERHIDEAINAGNYRYHVRLLAENANFVLSGTVDYVIEFEITSLVIADIDALLQQVFIEIPYDERYNDGYNYAEDDPVIGQAIVDSIFGENAIYVDCSGISTPKIGAVHVSPTNPMLENNVYEIKANLSIKMNSDGSCNYAFVYMGRKMFDAGIVFRVKLVGTENT